MYSKICVQWAADHFGLSMRYVDPLSTEICAKNDFFCILASSDLDL